VGLHAGYGFSLLFIQNGFFYGPGICRGLPAKVLGRDFFVKEGGLFRLASLPRIPGKPLKRKVPAPLSCARLPLSQFAARISQKLTKRDLFLLLSFFNMCKWIMHAKEKTRIRPEKALFSWDRLERNGRARQIS
jgi:hypothetical protein